MQENEIKEFELPEGWRKIELGEIVLIGDYFNCLTSYPDEKPQWWPYKTLIGNKLLSNMLSIRRIYAEAKIPANSITFDGNFNYFKTNGLTVKERVKKYLTN